MGVAFAAQGCASTNTSDGWPPSGADVDVDAATTPAGPHHFDAALNGEAPALDASSATALDAAGAPLDSSHGDGCGPDALHQQISEHACLHANAGPFRSVLAAASVLQAPDVSRPHTAFAVQTPVAKGSLSYVSFQATHSGAHAIFLSRASLRALLAPDQSVLSSQASASRCAQLTTLHVVQLSADQRYLLALAPDEGAVQLVIEPLTSESADAWQGPCDGQPAPDAGLCRSSGPCSDDSECCSYCHDYDHCH